MSSKKSFDAQVFSAEVTVALKAAMQKYSQNYVLSMKPAFEVLNNVLDQLDISNIDAPAVEAVSGAGVAGGKKKKEKRVRNAPISEQSKAALKRYNNFKAYTDSFLDKLASQLAVTNKMEFNCAWNENKSIWEPKFIKNVLNNRKVLKMKDKKQTFDTVKSYDEIFAQENPQAKRFLRDILSSHVYNVVKQDKAILEKSWLQFFSRFMSIFGNFLVFFKTVLLWLLFG